jgi:hypothetical protein
MGRRYLFLALLSFYACMGPSKEEQKLLTEAATIHNAAYKLAGELEEELEMMRTDTTVNADSITLLLSAIETWESALVEVPGNEAHHNHEEGEAHHHHHEHSKTIDVTPQEMLKVQNELRKQLDVIAQRTNNLRKD